MNYTTGCDTLGWSSPPAGAMRPHARPHTHTHNLKRMENVTSVALAGSAGGELMNKATDKPNFLRTGAGYDAAQDEPMADEYELTSVGWRVY